MRDLVKRIDAAITELEEIRAALITPSWNDDVDAVMIHSGHLPLSEIYRRIKQRRLRAGRSWPCNAHAIIRKILQERCVSYERGVWAAGLDCHLSQRTGRLD